MAETIKVAEWMAEFIDWTNKKEPEEVRKLIRDHLAEIKEQYEKSKESRIDEGFKWDNALEPNDGNDQWKHGGDCTMCRKNKYCGTQCRANKLLKRVATPFLYQLYLTENPDAAAKKLAGTDPETLLKQVGLL